jgi:hypothetical protein
MGCGMRSLSPWERRTPKLRPLTGLVSVYRVANHKTLKVAGEAMSESLRLHEVAATCDIPHPTGRITALLGGGTFENLTSKYLMGATPPARQRATQYVSGAALLIFFAQPCYYLIILESLRIASKRKFKLAKTSGHHLIFASRRKSQTL